MPRNAGRGGETGDQERSRATRSPAAHALRRATRPGCATAVRCQVRGSLFSETRCAFEQCRGGKEVRGSFRAGTKPLRGTPRAGPRHQPLGGPVTAAWWPLAAAKASQGRFTPIRLNGRLSKFSLPRRLIVQFRGIPSLVLLQKPVTSPPEGQVASPGWRL